jgi:hypothetical protein
MDKKLIAVLKTQGASHSPNIIMFNFTGIPGKTLITLCYNCHKLVHRLTNIVDRGKKKMLKDIVVDTIERFEVKVLKLDKKK